MYFVFFSRARYTEPNLPRPRGLPISKSSRHHCLPFWAASAVAAVLKAVLALELELEDEVCWLALELERGVRWSACDRFIPGDDEPCASSLFSLLLLL